MKGTDYSNEKKQIVLITKEEYKELSSKGELNELLAYYLSKDPNKDALKIDMRVPQLKAMHSFCCNSNDERITMHWLGMGVPDGADIYDYFSIATDDSMYKDICESFKACVNSEGWEF